MPLESVTHISDLVATNPTSTDPKSEGDNHLRNIKTALKTDFPNISGPVTKTHTQLNNALDKTGDTMTGSLDFSGTGLRLTGDFSNATVANRLMFQTSASNSSTSISAIPSGTAVVSSFNAYNASDPSNAAIMQAQAWPTDIRFVSGVLGSGTLLPMTFYISGTEALRIDTSRNVLVTGSGGLGYGVGSGGTVTQATSKTTAVTLNKPSGLITMNNATLNAGASVVFTLNNTLINPGGSPRDCVVVHAYNSGNYRVEVSDTLGEAARIRVTNITGSNLAEALLIQFVVIKGATS